MGLVRLKYEVCSFATFLGQQPPRKEKDLQVDDCCYTIYFSFHDFKWRQ